MALIITFKDLLVWQKAHQLTIHVYKITKTFPKEEKIGLVSQMRRAAVSVPSNIVEGFRRQTARDSLRFYNIADASLEELKCQTMLSKDLMLLDPNVHNQTIELCEEVGRMLCRWRQHHHAKTNS